MKNKILLIIKLAAIILAITIIYNFVIPICFFAVFAFFDRSDELQQMELSPDGKHIAYVIKCDAGATTRVTYQLRITGRHTKYNRFMRGNVCILDGSFNIEWVSADKLRVNYTDVVERVYKQKYNYRDIEIEYGCFS